MNQSFSKLAFVLMAGFATLSSNGFAKGVQCFEDARPRDGVYEEVRVQETSTGFDVVRKVITPGFGSPVTTTETVLAKDLKCNIDGVVAYCTHIDTTSRPTKYSHVTFKIHEVTDLGSLQQKKAQKQPAVVRIEVRSPLVNAPQSYQFRIADSFGGCKTL